MDIGDVRYKFVDNNGVQQEIVVPAKVLRSGRREGLTNRQSMMKYAAETGYAVTPPQIDPEKKTNKTTTRKRKVNPTKSLLMDKITSCLSELGETEVINTERQTRVKIDGITYEVTLVQKRG